MCGPFRVAAVGLVRADQGKPSPAWPEPFRRAAVARRARSLLLVLGELPCPPWGLSENGEMTGKGRCAEITAVCISVPFSCFLGARYHGFAVPGRVGRAPSAASCVGSLSLLLMLSRLVFKNLFWSALFYF